MNKIKKCYFLIYKITNLLNNKIYIGKHKTYNINDNYMGSGSYLRQAQKKYGIENFKKEILFECSSEEEMNQKEKDIVNQDFLKRDDVYNLKLGGDNGWEQVNKYLKANPDIVKLSHEKRKATIKKWSEERKQQFIEKMLFTRSQWTEEQKTQYIERQRKSNTGKRHTEETKERIKNAIKGTKRTPETCEKIRQNNLNRSKEINQKISNSLKNKIHVFNPTTNKETLIDPQELDNYLLNGYIRGRKKFSEQHLLKMKLNHKNPTINDEFRRKSGDSSRNTKYMFKNNIVKRVKNELVESYLSDGWKLGRKII